MDGPSINWKLYDEFSKHRENLELPNLIDIGSCSVQLVRGVRELV